MKKSILLVLAAAALAAVGAHPAAAKTARCAIKSADGAYNGPCDFTAERGGSFSVSATGKRFLVPNIMIVSVAMIEPGVAEVRGLTRDGINSRWGTATRSKKDKACWVGSDFSVCAY